MATLCNQGRIADIAALCAVIVLACGMLIAPAVVYQVSRSSWLAWR